jgi:tight adherence protein B
MLMLAAGGMAIAVTLGCLVLMRVFRSGAANFQDSMTSMAQGNLADLFIFVDPRRLWLLTLAAVITIPSLVLMITGNPVMALIVAVLVMAGPHLMLKTLRKRRHHKLARQMPDGLASLAGALRAGLSLPQALASLAEQQPAPFCQEFELVVRKQRLGMPLDQALAELEARVPGNEVSMFVTAVRIARELGGNLSESLERLADTLRRKLAMEDKIVALTSQGKIQGWIVGLLPIFLAGVLSFMEPEAMKPLFTTAIGYVVLGAIAVLELIGFVVIRKIVNIEV